MKSWGTTYFLIMTSVFLLSRRSPLWMGIHFQLANFWKTGDFEIGSVVVAVFFGGEWKSWTGRACWRSSGPSGEVAPELPEGDTTSTGSLLCCCCRYKQHQAASAHWRRYSLLPQAAFLSIPVFPSSISSTYAQIETTKLEQLDNTS